mgnify:CR=1 FL=1
MKKRIHALLSALLVMSLLLSGCGQKTDNPGSATSGASSSTQTSGPKDEVVTMAIISTWNTLNIYNTSGNYGHCVADQMFERMVSCTHDGEYLPRLAEKWEMSEDNTSMTFYLNPNAKWQDGQPLTADDVVFTLKAVTNEKMDNYYRSKFVDVAGTDDNGMSVNADDVQVEALDEHTVKIGFKTPKDEGTILSQLCSFLYILPKHLLDTGDYADINTSDFWSAPVGAGPFKYVRDTAGEELELTANEDYYLGCPDFKTFVIKVVPAASLTAGLLNGDIDVVGAGSIPLADWETVKSSDSLNAQSVESYSYQYMEFNLSEGNAAFQDRNVRIAFDKAINKQLMVDQLMAGEGQVAVGPMPKYHPYYNSALVGNTYDPDAAKQMLETAGFDFSRTYRLIVPQGNQVREQSALIIQQNLKDIGIDVKIETYDFATLLEMMRNGDFDLGLLGGGSNIDPSESAVIVKPGSAQNYSLLTDSKWYDLVSKGNSLADYAGRKEAFDAYQQALVDDQPYIWLYHQNDLRAYSKRITQIPLEDFIWYNYEVWTWKLA